MEENENKEVNVSSKTDENIEDINENIEEMEDIEDVDFEGGDGLKISNDAVATYAGIAIAEVQGVYAMSGGFAGFTEALSGKKNFAKGIKVDIDGSKVKIDVSIVVEYGARIPEVAFEIQSMVKKSVETMTGLKVTEVNVHVNGVHMASKDDKKEESEETEKKEEN